jgi:hypothetical protein
MQQVSAAFETIKTYWHITQNTALSKSERNWKTATGG